MKDNSGPTFPQHCGVSVHEDREIPLWDGGMTLRDYFATHILAAMVSSARLDGIELALPEQEAITAYEWADAMLDARGK